MKNENDNFANNLDKIVVQNEYMYLVPKDGKDKPLEHHIKL